MSKSKYELNCLYRPNYVVMVQNGNSAPCIFDGPMSYCDVKSQVVFLNNAIGLDQSTRKWRKNFGTADEPWMQKFSFPKLERQRFFYKRIVCKVWK